MKDNSCPWIPPQYNLSTLFWIVSMCAAWLGGYMFRPAVTIDLKPKGQYSYAAVRQGGVIHAEIYTSVEENGGRFRAFTSVLPCEAANGGWSCYSDPHPILSDDLSKVYPKKRK